MSNWNIDKENYDYETYDRYSKIYCYDHANCESKPAFSDRPNDII